MKTIRFFTMSLLTVMLVVTTSCKTKQEKNTVKPSDEMTKPVTVSTEILKKTMIIRENTYTANLLPFREVNLAPASPGKIEKINVDVSDRVRKGQVLVFMDRTNLEQAKINLINLETSFRRLDTLKKTNSIAEQQYDQAKTAYEAAKISYQFLLDNTLLRAPFDGVVSGKYFENGEIYSGAPVPTIGKAAVISLVQINHLKAVVNIEAAYFPVVKEGLKAEITSDIFPGQIYSGTVYRKYPTIDPTTKTFTVELKVPNNNLDLRPGMFARVKLNMGRAKVLLIPTIAIIKQIGTNDKYVFVNNRNRAEKRLIKPGRVYDDQTEILKGLREGDELIIEGQNKLMENKPLSIKN